MAVLVSGGGTLSKLYSFALHPAFDLARDADVGWNDREESAGNPSVPTRETA